MHSSIFSTRKTNTGWVIDATKIDGSVEQLVGVYNSEHFASKWILDRAADWENQKMRKSNQ